MEMGLDVRHNQSREAVQSGNRMKKTAPVAERSKEAEQALADLRANRVSGVSETNKTERLDTKPEGTARASERPMRDRYVPETAEDRASFGHYQPVSDGESGTKIQFNAPTNGEKSDETAPAQLGSTTRETAARDSVKGSAEGNTKEQAPSASVTALKAKQRALEKQLKSASDAESRKEIKKKLEQIKRQIKVAEH